jgi:hypothetical protein
MIQNAGLTTAFFAILNLPKWYRLMNKSIFRAIVSGESAGAGTVHSKRSGNPTLYAGLMFAMIF